MTPLDYYLDQQARGLITSDDEQRRVIGQLQSVYFSLVSECENRQRLLSRLRKPTVVRGLYLWGGVGIGKTFMMDCFYNSIPFKNKMRMHFHQFMQFIHDELKRHKGQKNPLSLVAKSISKSSLLICLDEFIVNDIVDAMLLARLLEALFANGITIVTTSNIEPDQLYTKGLQRSSFLPAIALIKQYLSITHVASVKDYRLSFLKSAGVYYTPDDQHAMQLMEKTFELVSHHQPVEVGSIQVLGRSIVIIKKAGDTIWFDFNAICRPPRSQHDYLELAKHYRTVLISHVPLIPSDAKDTISLFIRLVDVFYDARIRLVISAEATVDRLYTGTTLLPEYLRTQSRLIEMQSERYFTS